MLCSISVPAVAPQAVSPASEQPYWLKTPVSISTSEGSSCGSGSATAGEVVSAVVVVVTVVSGAVVVAVWLAAVAAVDDVVTAAAAAELLSLLPPADEHDASISAETMQIGIAFIISPPGHNGLIISYQQLSVNHHYVNKPHS